MPPGTERSQSTLDAWLYFAPRAGMAERVDAADSKSVALKRRVGSIPSPGTTDELLQQLWLPRRPQSSRGRFPAPARVRAMRDHPLSESEDRGRPRARVPRA